MRLDQVVFRAWHTLFPLYTRTKTPDRAADASNDARTFSLHIRRLSRSNRHFCEFLLSFSLVCASALTALRFAFSCLFTRIFSSFSSFSLSRALCRSLPRSLALWRPPGRALARKLSLFFPFIFLSLSLAPARALVFFRKPPPPRPRAPRHALRVNGRKCR